MKKGVDGADKKRRMRLPQDSERAFFGVFLASKTI